MNIVITAGGTNEKIDDVRYITNMSTGKLGMEIYTKIKDLYPPRNVHIFYIYAKGAEHPLNNMYSTNVTLIEVSDTASVEVAVKKVISENKIDYFIHSMAISDYSVDNVFKIEDGEFVNIDNNSKISSSDEKIYVAMKKTPKIIDMIKSNDKNIFLISFKLLSDVSRDNLIEVARKQLKRTDSDIVIANDLKSIREGSHDAIFVTENETKDISGKSNIATEIKKIIFKLP